MAAAALVGVLAAWNSAVFGGHQRNAWKAFQQAWNGARLRSDLDGGQFGR